MGKFDKAISILLFQLVGKKGALKVLGREKVEKRRRRRAGASFVSVRVLSKAGFIFLYA